MALRIRRGLDIERQSIIPAEGEPLYCTDTGMLYIGDGSTIGGNLVTGIRSLLDDPTPALSANLDLNSNNIVGMGDINIVGDLTVSGNLNIDAVKADYRGSLFGDDSTLLVNGFDHTVHASIIANDGTKLVNTDTGEIDLKNTILDSLGDVSTKDAANGDGLFYDGNHWVAKPFGADGTGNPPLGSILQWVPGSGWMAQTFIMSADSSPMMNFETGEIFLGQTNLESIRNVFINQNTIQPDEVLVWDGLNWTHKEIDASSLQLQGIDLDSIEGVFVPSPSKDDLLYFDGNNWINTPGTIDVLKDVVIDGPGIDHFLRFDGYNWKNDFVSFNSIDGCVILRDPEEYDILLHDGYNWTNQTLKLDALSDVNVSSTPIDSSALVYDNGMWTAKTFDLDSLSDVDISITPTESVVLKYDQQTATWTGGFVDLASLTDVEAPAPVHGDVLVWSSTDQAWQSKELGLGELSDVEDAMSPFDGDVLTWNNSINIWQPSELHLNSLKDVEIDITALDDGDVLTWTGIAWESVTPNTVLGITEIDSADLEPGDFLIWNGTHFVNQQFAPPGTDMYQGSVLGNDSTIMVDATNGTLYGRLISDDIEVEYVLAGSLETKEVYTESVAIRGVNSGSIRIEREDDTVKFSDSSERIGSLEFSSSSSLDGGTIHSSIIIAVQDKLMIGHGYNNNSVGTDFLTIESGKLHIGSHLQPTERLEVEGNTKITGFTQFGSYTTVERDDLTTTNSPQYANNFGMVIYNTDTNTFQGWQNTGGTTAEWVNLS